MWVKFIAQGNHWMLWLGLNIQLIDYEYLFQTSITVYLHQIWLV